ncbi:MAG TPA: hypothetical protein VJZ00_06485 [Thermoanaerobaculia bacterium]|nr:hypothetical protein [Thermoanaerobaculia bacterium]
MTQKIDLTEYIKHCEALLRDVRDAIADEDDRADRGYKFRYAVDYSEIYSYIIPGRSHETAPIADGWSNDPERQFYVLSRFFGEPGILLPQPYAVELGTLVDEMGKKDFKDLAKTFLDARKEIPKIFEMQQTKDILDRIADGSSAQMLTAAELDELFEYFETYAPKLIAFARGMDLDPFDRLKDLFRRGILTPFEKDYPDVDEFFDEARAQRRFKLLSVIRPLTTAAANHIDARALGEVEAVNELLEQRGEKTRVLLISRSQHLMTIARSEVPDGPVCVRHPRTMSASYRTDGRVALADRREMKIREQSLIAFIDGAEEVQKKILSGESAHGGDILDAKDSKGKTLRSHLETIQSEWRNVEAYATGLTDEGETRAKKKSRKKDAIDVLNYLRDPDRLRKRIVDEIQKIFGAVRRNRDTVAFHLQRKTASRGSVVYPMKFRDPALQQATEELSADWSTTLDDAKRLFDVAIRCEDDYECLLGIALSLGAIGRWPLAKQYVEYALVGRDPRQTREGRFLRAITIKRMSIEEESSARTFTRMQTAIESLEELIKETSTVDPRYYNERAALKLWLIEFANRPESAPVAKATLLPQLVASELEDALAHATGKVKLLILNNLCYAHLLEEDAEQKTALKNLRNALTDMYSDRTSWPPAMVDTVVYTSFRLRGKDAKKEDLLGWAEELREVGRTSQVTQERHVIATHANEIAEEAKKIA